MNRATEHFSVLVLGAGLSGLCVGKRLRDAGVENFRILEKADEVGGTWRDNTYPGVACDVPSQLYSFSFKLASNWSRSFPQGREVLDYCKECVAEFGLEDSIEFNATVEAVVYEDERWHVELSTGRRLTSDAVVVAIGGLHVPSVPRFDAMTDFSGRLFHSSRWDHTSPLAGSDVALVGTGASAVQIGPQLARQARQLYVFQRSAAWVLPRHERAVGALERALLKHLPGARRLRRMSDWLVREVLGMGYTARGSLINRVAKWIALRELRRNVQNPQVRSQLTPNYAIGCKRLCISDDYYAMFSRSNVQLVTSPIAKFEKDGIRTADGELYRVSTSVLATGFKPFDIVSKIRFRGLRGTRLEDQWQGGAKTYKTVMVNNFPNLFLMYGPNSGTGHMSALQMIESQAAYVVRCLKLLKRHQLRSIHPTAASVVRFNAALQGSMKTRVFGGGCNAWYESPSGENHTLWPYSTLRFRWALLRPRLADFEAVPLAATSPDASRTAREAARQPKGDPA